MALGDLSGRSRLRYTSPTAQGECDRCGFWYQLSALSHQFEWRGPSLADTGLLVCRRCLDKPFEQNRTILIPPDPQPRVNARPSHDNTAPFYGPPGSPPTSPLNQGFTALTLGGAVPGLYPTTKADALAQIAVVTGIATPGVLIDRSITIIAGQDIQVMAANPLRTWVALYNPTQQPCEFALSVTAWNNILNLSIGPGQTFFWATAQGLGDAWIGVITAVGQYSGLPLWAWENG